MFFTNIDTLHHVAISDNGDILSIEDYLDFDENPCLSDEAAYAMVRTGSHSYERVPMFNYEEE